MIRNGMASAIIVAAGKGSRMNTDINKQYLMLCNKPVLAHTLDVFERVQSIFEIIVVIHSDDRALFQDCILNRYPYSKITSIVNGGYDRQESVSLGLAAVCSNARIIAVHDGARPLITPDIVARSIEVASSNGAACVGVPVKDTIKQASHQGIVKETLDRTFLWSIQTPQVFQKEILMKAHQGANEERFRGTDDAMLAERLGYPIQMVMGSYANIKITTPEDMLFAESVLQNR